VYPCPYAACIVDYFAQSQVTAPKSEPVTPAKSLRRKRAAALDSSSEDDDTPLASSPVKQSAAISMPGTSKASTVNGHKAVKAESDGKRSSTAAKKKRASTKKGPPQKKLKREDHDASESPASEGEESTPVKKEKVSRKRKSKVKEETDAEVEEAGKSKSAKKRAVSKKVKDGADGSATPQPKKKGKVKDEAEDEEEVYKWWEAQQNNDGEVKWQTLEHNGVIFPPPYEPLPSNVKMRYKGMWSSYSFYPDKFVDCIVGKEVDLPLESEEVAGFYAAMLETEHAQDATFNKNFFEDWLKVLQDHPPVSVILRVPLPCSIINQRNKIKITNFEDCDFRPMFEHFEAEKAKKKALSTAEKKELKKQKDAFEEKYVTCLLDGRKEKVGNFRVEPPGLFRGRGDHPKKGALKVGGTWIWNRILLTSR
jgi:DNA topoisomerase-1